MSSRCYDQITGNYSSGAVLISLLHLRIPYLLLESLFSPWNLKAWFFIPVSGALLASSERLKVYINVGLGSLDKSGTIVFLVPCAAPQASYNIQKFLHDDYDGKLSLAKRVIFSGVVLDFPPLDPVFLEIKDFLSRLEVIRK